MPGKSTASFSTDWRSNRATDSAIAKFKEGFEKSMGAPLLIGREVEPYRVISTGSLVLDAALGVGGLPVGRIHEYWGPEHAGKTTLATLAAVEAQRSQPDKIVGWVDMEQTFDVRYAISLGLDMKRVAFFTPKSAEDTADATKKLVMSGLCSLVVLDSVGGMVARLQMQKNADESTVGLVPKIVTEMVLTCSPMAASNGTTVLVINQVRAAIGGHGPDTTTGGGWALKHITTIKNQIRRAGGAPLTVKQHGKDVPVGYSLAVKVQKNKVFPYGETAELILRNRSTDKHGPIGLDKATEAVTIGLRMGSVVQQNGGYYLAPDGERLHGRPALTTYFRDHPDLIEQVRGAAIAELAGGVREDEDASDEPVDPGSLDWSEASA